MNWTASGGFTLNRSELLLHNQKTAYNPKVAFAPETNNFPMDLWANLCNAMEEAGTVSAAEWVFAAKAVGGALDKFHAAAAADQSMEGMDEEAMFGCQSCGVGATHLITSLNRGKRNAVKAIASCCHVQVITTGNRRQLRLEREVPCASSTHSRRPMGSGKGPSSTSSDSFGSFSPSEIMQPALPRSHELKEAVYTAVRQHPWLSQELGDSWFAADGGIQIDKEGCCLSPSPSSSGSPYRGFELLKQCGWSPESPGLGKRGDGTVEPLAASLVFKKNKLGLGYGN
jgi:hypothetical protein